MKKTPDSLFGTFLEIRGNTFLCADGYGKMLEYGKDIIVLQGKKLTLTVYGKNLKMHYLTGDKISIDGIIRGVKYEPTVT